MIKKDIFNNKNLFEIKHSYEGELFSIYGDSFFKTHNYILLVRFTKSNCDFLLNVRKSFQNQNFLLHYVKYKDVLVFHKFMIVFFLIQLYNSKLAKQGDLIEKQLTFLKNNKEIFCQIFMNCSCFLFEIKTFGELLLYKEFINLKYLKQIIPFYVKTGSNVMFYNEFENYLMIIQKCNNNEKFLILFFYRISFFIKIILYLNIYFKIEKFLFQNIDL